MYGIYKGHFNTIPHMEFLELGTNEFVDKKRMNQMIKKISILKSNNAGKRISVYSKKVKSLREGDTRKPDKTVNEGLRYEEAMARKANHNVLSGSWTPANEWVPRSPNDLRFGATVIRKISTKSSSRKPSLHHEFKNIICQGYTWNIRVFEPIHNRSCPYHSCETCVKCKSGECAWIPYGPHRGCVTVKNISELKFASSESQNIVRTLNKCRDCRSLIKLNDRWGRCQGYPSAQQRVVECISQVDLKTVSERHCDLNKRPESIRPCVNSPNNTQDEYAFTSDEEKKHWQYAWHILDAGTTKVGANDLCTVECVRFYDARIFSSSFLPSDKTVSRTSYKVISVESNEYNQCKMQHRDQQQHLSQHKVDIVGAKGFFTLPSPDPCKLISKKPTVENFKELKKMIKSKMLKKAKSSKAVSSKVTKTNEAEILKLFNTISNTSSEDNAFSRDKNFSTSWSVKKTLSNTKMLAKAQVQPNNTRYIQKDRYEQDHIGYKHKDRFGSRSNKDNGQDQSTQNSDGVRNRGSKKKEHHIQSQTAGNHKDLRFREMPILTSDRAPKESAENQSSTLITMHKELKHTGSDGSLQVDINSQSRGTHETAVSPHPCCCRNCKHRVNDGKSCQMCHVSDKIKNLIKIHNKIDTSGHYVCPIKAMTVRANGPGMNNASPDDYERAISQTNVILSAIGGLVGGVRDYQNALLPVITSSAKLLNPALLPFRVLNKHFFSDVDGRAQYGVMGTPGGDLGEFFLAMDTLEKMRPNELGKLTFEEVLQHLEDFLSMMPYEGKEHFFFQSDNDSLESWERDAEVANAAVPSNPAEKSRLIETISRANNVGSRYFKLLLLQPESFNTHIGMVSNVLRAFFTIYYDTRHPSRPRLLFAIMEGKHKEEGIVIIDRTRDYPCDNMVPLVVPQTRGKSLLIFHRAAAEIHRASMSEWLTHRMVHADQLAGRLYIQLNHQGLVNFDVFRSHYYSDLPRYSVAFAPQNEPLVT